MSERFHHRQSELRHRRHRAVLPADPVLPPDIMLPPVTRLIYPRAAAPDKAAWSAMALGQRALGQDDMRKAERWLSIAGRFVSLGRGLAVLKADRKREEDRHDQLMDMAQFLSGIEPEDETEAGMLIDAVVEQWHEADARECEEARQQAGADAAL